MATAKRSKQAAARSNVIAGDATWYKDAIIYQIHVRSFCDANDDGIGDFRGLTSKLDYIRDLGVTAIWLMPFFPSPLRDDGYDIADYTSVNPMYGTLPDFKTFLREAHQRDLRVITEMVMNHTSDQHAWFQKSRSAKPDSKWRDYYVWSDTTERYQDARVIFTDFEPSNWTWDPVADAYFWHRFYHHQPDLNFDNPDVHTAMLESIDFWLDLGVDGVRLDAVPYLYEREGTNCENLPETHAFLKKLRRHVDEKYTGRMLLAEANQWPEDAAHYFGEGDECHMNFHFPLMPRLFMAMEREDRFPIIDILEQTPAVPENCQWGIFLRNHDELTLEMVTDEERDYMYRTYADDPRARVNLGIRRRLAPLLRDNRRKIELMNGLLLSLPGTPIIYYGDEIRMGDNIYLGDRNGVRTPMQWTDDRNAGFSRANPQQLFLPVVIDTAYHYASRNVEIEQRQPHSMLWWMRRIISLRKSHPAFGRGSLEFLSSNNSKVLVYLRRHGDETVLVVANLSRYVQSTEVDLSRFRGQTPVEIFGDSRLPPIGELPYFLTLGPYGFYWFVLEWRPSEVESLNVPLPSTTISGRWDSLFEEKPLATLEAALPEYLKRHRWFSGKARSIRHAKLLDVLTVSDPPKRATAHSALGSPPRASSMRLLLVRVDYVEGEPDTYVLPMVFAIGAQARNITGDRPSAGLLSIERDDPPESATLCDTTREEEFWLQLYDGIALNRSIAGRRGELHPVVTKALGELGAAAARDVTTHAGEQSNTSAIIGKRFIFKLFRRLAEGVNPDLEIGRHFTEKAPLDCVPRVAGALEYRGQNGTSFTLAVLHEFVPNGGDAWTFTLDELDRYLERVESEVPELPSSSALPPGLSLLELADRQPTAEVQGLIGPYLQAAKTLGQRTAEMHQALVDPATPAFAPEAFSKLYQRSLYQSLRAQAKRTLTLLRHQRNTLSTAAGQKADELLQHEETLLQQYLRLLDHPISAQRTRGHGDYHLGQVLVTGNDFKIIDFEGEPDRPLSERRIKTSPLRDVAGMLRSFHYAIHAALHARDSQTTTVIQSEGHALAWLNVWYAWVVGAYLGSYRQHFGPSRLLPTDRADLDVLLNTFVLQKAVYELGYELNNRPDWVLIPLEGILGQLSVGKGTP